MVKCQEPLLQERTALPNSSNNCFGTHGQVKVLLCDSVFILFCFVLLFPQCDLGVKAVELQSVTQM